MVTVGTSAGLQAWRPALLPEYWTQDPATARASLLLRARNAGIGDGDTLQKALEWVEQAHRGQFRKGTNAPYAVHPYRIACSLVESFGIDDVPTLCAALLHDVLEETQITRETLEAEFGKRCADLVAVLSRLPGEQRPPGGDTADSPYLRRIAAHGDDAILLKIADKVDNLRDASSHPDRNRAAVFVNETFPTYVPVARSLADARLRQRAERLLLEAAGHTGGIQNPHLLRALLDLTRHALAADADLQEIPFPELAVTLYLHLNPGACVWLEYDGLAITRQRVESRELAMRVAGSLRRKLGSPELPLLLEIAGMPPAFASRANEELWQRAAAQLARLQRLLGAAAVPAWLEVLLRDGHEPLLLALVQSGLYLPASWRSPLWSLDLGAVLSARVRELSQDPAAALFPLALSHRLAWSRHEDGSGTRERAGKVFEQAAGLPFAPEALWAFRIGAESLQDGGDRLETLWNDVHRQPFDAGSLPLRESLADLAAGAAGEESVETVAIPETKALFAGAGLEEQFEALLRLLVREPLESGWTRWIDLDAAEWRKRRPRWSQLGEFRVGPETSAGELETAGARVVRRRFGTTELLTVLPARRFALRDRLPELTPAGLAAIERGGFSAASMFDALILDAASAHPLWIPRIYRLLDTIEDLDPAGVQILTVDYEGVAEAVPSLRVVLPLPADQEEATRQPERKALVARYILAQVYSCGLVRWIRRARIGVSAVPEPRRPHAFTDAELRTALAEAETKHGFRTEFGPYIERYGFDAFGIIPDRPDLRASPFGPEEMRQGVYVGVDIGGQRVKIAVVRDGSLLSNPSRQDLITPGNVRVAEFCGAILGDVTRELESVAARWEEVRGIGVSWPGAVRDNRIAGMSHVLQVLNDEGKTFSRADPIERLTAFDILADFRKAADREAGERQVALRPDLAFSIINDGDAEAFGNHVLRTLNGLGKPGAKIFVKLGTGIAGGRITGSGEVAEDVAEFSKILLTLPAADAATPWVGVARRYLSSEAVRNLTRTFVFDGRVLFGERDGANRDDSAERIEPVELGRLLPLFAEGTEREAFLSALVATDNAADPVQTAAAIATTAAALRTSKCEALVGYVRDRGRDAGREVPGWKTGFCRVEWLATGTCSGKASEDGVLPDDFPFDALARVIAGSVALFSQLGLHVAHLVAQLYNIYRRETFAEVVLAGGVLSGESGAVVERQTRAFLRKYYDKIYGEGKPLGTDAIVRSGIEGVANPGVYGAAMAASRQWQMERDRVLARRIEQRLRVLPVGEEVTLDELLAGEDDPSARRVLRLLEPHLAAGEIARTPDGRIQKVS